MIVIDPRLGPSLIVKIDLQTGKCKCHRIPVGIGNMQRSLISLADTRLICPARTIGKSSVCVIIGIRSQRSAESCGCARRGLRGIGAQNNTGSSAGCIWFCENDQCGKSRECRRTKSGCRFHRLLDRWLGWQREGKLLRQRRGDRGFCPQINILELSGTRTGRNRGW